MKQHYFLKILGCALSISLLSINSLRAEPVKLKAEIANGQRAVVMTNYITNAVTVNLVPNANGAASDVKITNPAGSGQNAIRIRAYQNGQEITAQPCGPNCLFGELAGWPGGETSVIYQFEAPQTTPPAYLTEPCLFKGILEPGDFCNIRLSASPGAPAGSQQLQIKGENTVVINVSLNVN